MSDLVGNPEDGSSRVATHIQKSYLVTLFLPVLSADNLFKQFGPRSGPTKHQALSGSKLFDTNFNGILERFFLVMING